MKNFHCMFELKKKIENLNFWTIRLLTFLGKMRDLLFYFLRLLANNETGNKQPEYFFIFHWKRKLAIFHWRRILDSLAYAVSRGFSHCTAITKINATHGRVASSSFLRLELPRSNSLALGRVLCRFSDQTRAMRRRSRLWLLPHLLFPSVVHDRVDEKDRERER